MLEQLEARSNDVLSEIMSPTNASASIAVDVQTAVQHINAGRMPKILCIVTELTENQLQLAKM